MTRSLTGIGVSPGLASGPVAKLAPAPTLPANPPPVADTQADITAAVAAIEAVATDLEVRSKQAGPEAAGVLGAQVMMVQDPVLADKIALLVKDGRPAAHAVAGAFDAFRARLAAAGPYMAERAADLDDLRDLGVCGEAASDPALALVLVGLGVTSLSMAPVSLPEVRSNLARHSAADCRNLAVLALQATDGRSARAAVRRNTRTP